MKTAIFLLMTSTFTLLISCNKNEEKPEFDPKPSTYVGLLKVNENTPASYEQNDVEIISEIIDNISLEMTLLQVKFSVQMPVKLNMTIKNIELTKTNDGYTISGDNIIPTSGEIPYNQYVITNLAGTMSSKKLEFTMKCGNFPVSYSGNFSKNEK